MTTPDTNPDPATNPDSGTDPGTDTYARREDLGRMLRTWRMARDPALVPGAVPARGGRRTYLTQLDMALLLGVSERWYRALEKGEDRRYGQEMITGVARILDLGPEQSAALHRGTGHEPPRPYAPAPPDPALLHLMHRQRCVSYLCDPAWDVLDANTVAARHCPWLVRPGTNVMTWAFSPEARYQLREWESRWAGPLLSTLRLAWQRRSEDTRLDEVVREIRARPEAAALWDTPAASASPDARPDTWRSGSRPMYFPLVAPDPVPVRLLTLAPQGGAAARWHLLLPEDPELTFP